MVTVGFYVLNLYMNKKYRKGRLLVFITLKLNYSITTLSVCQQEHKSLLISNK